MLIPSYAELMNVLNQEIDKNSEITSRYTIVIAAAKRARQLIEGDESMVKNKNGKPVSIAVDEIYQSKIKIVPEGEGTILKIKPKELSKSKEDLSPKEKLLSKLKIGNPINIQNNDEFESAFEDADDDLKKINENFEDEEIFEDEE